MYNYNYFMESDDETLRLDLKTDQNTLEKQAIWAGIQPGMRVADLGFGSGKTTFFLNKLVQPHGSVVGVDFVENRIQYANLHYSDPKIEYLCRNICDPLDDLGLFDFIWVRFVLEYHRSKSFEIVKNISRILKTGGLMCLIDLDYNCLNHYGLSQRFEKALFSIITNLEKNTNFDPYVGRKLYSYLYDLGYQNIDVDMAPHNLIFGELTYIDNFNWTKKVEVAIRKSGYQFEEYNGGYEEFFEEFKRSFADRRRFTYTPLIACRGVKPSKR